ncbi:protein disulfide isomerase [Chamberlinius hualienensis]|uniref:Protein disulfide-isomerase n=1 Tax=Chamberlinius hualienensis TaxID=1551368 RepID=A0A455RD67_9MYRI|nr:chamberlinius hualienesis protein disulfide isomerase 2 [Chamberlinius hualienensis]
MKVTTMKSFVFVLLSLLISSAYCSDVIELHDSDFSNLVDGRDIMLVEFYAPWCGHCKKLAPEFDKAATELLKNDPPIPLAKVDCTESGKESCSKYGVGGYPTLKIFRNGEVSQDYNGPRDANGIVKYMRAQAGPSAKELKAYSELEAFISKEDVAIVGFFNSESSKLQEEFKKIADKLRESYRFAYTVAADIAKKAGHEEAVVLYRPNHLANKFEAAKVEYKGKADAGDIQKFINENYHGLVGHRTLDTNDQFKKPLITAYFKVDYLRNQKGTNYWRNRILKVASQNKDTTFAIANKDEFTSELSEFGFDYVAGDKPVIAARDKDNQKFVMKDEFSVENLEKFAKDFKDGKLEPYMKSEPIPETQGPVKVAVAKNFDDLVVNSKKDIFIEFYAPWCGHCKKLAPVFDEVGAELVDEQGVDIVKLDATANDVPPLFEVHGFPTLYFYKKDKSSPLRYDGGREKDDIIKYIAKHATDELDGYDRSGKKKSDKTEL